jgi:enamidase
VSTILVRNIGTLCTGSLDDPISEADSVYVENGAIISLGEHRGGADVVIDAAGSTVLPGLVDGHVHPTAGEYTPAQESTQWISKYVHGGTTSAVSAGELHHPGLPFGELTPDLVTAIAVTARQTLGRLRPCGMKMHAGTLLLVPGLTEGHFDQAAANGVGHVKFIFYDWSKGVTDEARRYVAWAHERSMTVKIHSGGVSRSGASVVAGFSVIAELGVDIVGHISGGPIPMSDSDIRDVINELACYVEVCSSMNYRATLVAVAELMKAEALGRLTLGTDTPGGTGVIPRGMLRNLLFIASLGEVPPELAVAVGTGNTARAHGLPVGRIEPGAPADFVCCDRIFGSSAEDALGAIRVGDLPGISLVVIDGQVRVAPRSEQTPPPARMAQVIES